MFLLLKLVIRETSSGGQLHFCPHRFIVHWIVISNDIKKVTKVIDVKNWRVDNSQILLEIVSLILWNSSVSSTKSSIQLAQARKNMMIYLKNMAGFKVEFFNGMSYKEIRPLFEEEYNKVQTLFKEGPGMDAERIKALRKRTKKEKVEKDQTAKKQSDVVRKYQALKRKPVSVAQARKNMMIYLKNMAGFKMEFFNGMSYKEIRPLFEEEYNKVQTLFKEGPEIDAERIKALRKRTKKEKVEKDQTATNTAGGKLNAANEEPVSVAPTNITTAQPSEATKITIDITTASKAKGIVFHNKEESTTRTASLKSQVKDNGKAKLVKEPKIQKSRKSRIAINEEVARRIETE
nr:hypothetical protein [Tanacetum cinerariifolium]